MPRVFACALIACLALAPGVATAQSADGHRAFAIPPLPLREALLRAGVQGGESIDVTGSERCGSSRGVRGRMSVDAALARLTLGTGCAVTRVGPDAWRVVRQPPRPPMARPQGLHPSPEPRDTPLDEIIVTAAQSDDIQLSRAPYGISAIDGVELERAGLSDVSDLASRVSGLSVTNLGPGRDKVFIRGMADGPVAGQTQALVGLYLDAVRLTYDAPDPALRLADIERVEVLRGPQGALYGSGSMGGVIQVVSRRPDTSGLYGRAMAEAGVTRDGGNSRTVEVMLNVPVLADRAAVRGVAYDEVIGGYLDDRALDLGNTGEVRRRGLRLSGLWRSGADWTLRGGLVAQTIHADDSRYATGGPDDPYGRRRSLTEPNRNDFDGLWLSLEGDLGWARLRAASSLQVHELDTRFDATPAAGLFGLSGPTAYDQADALSADVHEVRLEGEVGAGFSWRAGLFYSEYSHRRDMMVGPAGGGVPALHRERRDHIDEVAVFGDATWALGERLRLSGGARVFRLGVEHRSRSTEPGLEFSGDDAVIDVAPRLSAEYALDSVVLYVLATEGYRGAGFNAGDVTSGGQPVRRVRSDEIVSAEAGARFIAMDGRLKGRIAVFVADWTDIQSDRFDARGLPFTANLGDGRNRGVEAELEWRDSDWIVDGHLVLNDPELTAPDPGFALAVDSPLPSVADLTAQLGVSRRLTLGPAAVQGALRLSYVGPTEVALAPGARGRASGVLGSQVSVMADLGRWSLRLAVDNVLDLSDDTFSFGNPFFPAGTVDTPQRPRTVRLALISHF